MLTLVEVRGQAGILSLPIQDPSLGYDIQGIDGLDPVKATVVTSSFAQQDGAQYQSARRDTRNIVMHLGYYPDYVLDTVYTLRQRLYPFFMSKSAVDLRFFMENDFVVNISGTVESFESSMFTQEPKGDISIICPDPDFVESVPVIFSGSTTSGSTMSTINYPGTVETGMVIKLNVNRSLSAFTIYHQTPDGSLKSMDFAGSLVSGDVVTINTNSGAKAATLTRSGSDSSVLYAVSPQSYWPELSNGASGFRIYAAGAAIPYTLTYTRRYGGL